MRKLPGWDNYVLFSNYSQLAAACYEARIDLSAHGFYITPEIGFDWRTGKGIPFRYFTYGAAFAEVEIDTLTGDFHTRTANIFLDLGYSLNPAIDVGQVLLVLLHLIFFSCFLCSWKTKYIFSYSPMYSRFQVSVASLCRIWKV